MSKGTTWQKAKMEKLSKQLRTARFGDYNRAAEPGFNDGHSINTDKRIGTDRRDGRDAPMRYLEPSKRAKDMLSANVLALVTSGEVKIRKVEAGTASGLSRDIGREGKGRRYRATTCYGNGERSWGGAARNPEAAAWAAARSRG